MKLNNGKSSELEQEFQELLKFKSDSERLEFEAFNIHFAIINGVLQCMKSRNISKAELAQKLNILQVHLTRLFTGNSILNFLLLAKLKRVFGKELDIFTNFRSVEEIAQKEL